MARGAAIAWLFAMGCGRFGFDDLPQDDATLGDGGGDDGVATMDGPVRATCPAAQVPGVDLGPQAPVVAIAGTGTPLGYALSFQRGDTTGVDGLIVAADLSAATPNSPARATPIEGFNENYARVVLQWDGTRILGGLVTAGGSFFWKTFPDSMGLFTSAVEEMPTQQPASPFFATANGLNHAASFAGPQLALWELDGNGVPTGVFTGFGFGTDILAAGVVPRDADSSIGVVEAQSRGILAGELSNLGRATFDVDPQGTQPSVTGTSTQVHVTYVRGAELVVRTLDSTSLVVTPYRVVGSNIAGRYDSAVVRGELRVVWSDATGFHIGLDGAVFEEVVVTDLPAGDPDAWSLVERNGEATVFAAYGSQIWSIPICR